MSYHNYDYIETFSYLFLFLSLNRLTLSLFEPSDELSFVGYSEKVNISDLFDEEGTNSICDESNGYQTTNSMSSFYFGFLFPQDIFIFMNIVPYFHVK